MTVEKVLPEFPQMVDKPPFTLQEVRDAIPPQCWKRSLILSLYYFVRDIVFISFVYYVMIYHGEPFLNYLESSEVIPFAMKQLVSLAMWSIFWLTQGTLFWCLFVVGHDCGHGSFSDSKMWNDLIGHVSHTAILVPFHSWRISHKSHHSNTSNVEKDESFVAAPETYYKNMPLFTKIWRFHLYPLAGFTVYLICGMPVHAHSHLIPSLFKEDERGDVTKSMIWFWGFVAMLVWIGSYIGAWMLLKYYFVPYFIFSGWISIVTHLHHTHPDIPWYRNDDWNYLRGALSTVDRNYGIVEHFHHDIGTHIVHHIFSLIPHYHLKEATVAIKPILGKYYKLSNETVFQAMIRIWKTCRFVPDDGNVVFYQPEHSLKTH